MTAKERMRKWRETQKGMAYVKEYNKRYKRPDIEKTCLSCGSKFVTARQNQESCSPCSFLGSYAQKKYRIQNHQKVFARGVFRRNKKHGSCIICGSPAEKHHPDYSNPQNVVWLCKSHHSQHHANLKKI